MIGRTVGHYQVVEPLGAGGMGEVWRARDLRLQRDVALKALPEEVAGDPERRARFEREARAVAALNDPHIAAIHGVEEVDGRSYLILECVEGETLAERLARGPLPVEEAFEVALQLAAGLEAAHTAGVVHRDLKPANLKLTPQGRLKILDFGLAKIAPEVAAAELSQSPTLSWAATQAGVLLGTAAYMSPEQATGKAVDKRADVWAFGCVLYECLTGRRPFGGATVTDVLASILKEELDWEPLPAATPRAVRRLLRRCLAKDPARRLHDIADARIELEEAVEGPVGGETRGLGEARDRQWAVHIAWGVVALLLLAVAVALTTWRFGPRQAMEATFTAAAPALGSRYQLQPPRGVAVSETVGLSTLAISPDGRWVAFRGRTSAAPDDPHRLYLRGVGELEARPVPGTEGAWNPFFSPDSRWLGFWSRGALRRVPLDGGEPLVICDASRLRGASWREDGTVVFSAGEGLLRVSAEGGEPEVLTVPKSGDRNILHFWPHHLPGGRRVLFQVHRGLLESEHELAVLDLGTGEQRTLLRGGSYPRYAAGHLVFSRLGTLYAAPFDAERLALAGEPRPVLDDVYFDGGTKFVAYDLSWSGALVFTPGAPRVEDAELVRVDRQGKVSALVDRRAPYTVIRPSPDGRRIAVIIASGLEEWNLWVYEPGRDFWSRLTGDGRSYTLGPWTPDGRWILYSAIVQGAPKIFRIGADGSGSPEQLTTGSRWDYHNSVSPDGRVLLFQRREPGRWDLLTLELDGDRTPRAYLATPVPEAWGDFSPDGRWIVHEAHDEGTPEVYIRPYPALEPRIRISRQGGGTPRWSPRGDEIFFRCWPEASGAICSVPVELGPTLSVGSPVRLFTLDFLRSPWANLFSISPDGDHLYLVRYPTEQVTDRPIVYAPYWTAELAGW